ncbi:universal stress protein [Pseudonocardia sp.]|uniref:universal stress protein n=1 Tax=Pseudonocardia sp. TaxID=60912 RepID=UPI003D104A58
MNQTDTPAQPLVVGVDRSDSARDAAHWALDVAAAWAAPLHLVHVVPGSPDDAAPAAPSWLHELRDAAEREGVRPCRTEVVCGNPVDTLVTLATHARMLVLGGYGDRAWSGMLAGPVALELIELVRCPVAVIRGTAPQIPPPRTGAVVVGVDGRPDAHAALLLGAHLASALGTRVHALYARPDDTPGPDPHTLLDAAIHLALQDGPDTPIDREHVSGDVLTALLDIARGARAVVVGHEDDGHRADSISRRLIEAAPCPVIVVHHRPAHPPAP